MSEESKDNLNELFFDFVCYLIFMSKSIGGHRSPYGHFALLKGLEKILKSIENDVLTTYIVKRYFILFRPEGVCKRCQSKVAGYCRMHIVP